MREGKVGSIVVLLFLSILNASIVVPIKAEEEYHLVATLQSPIPHGYSGFGGEAILGDDFLVIGEPGAYFTEDITAGKIFVYDLDWTLITTIQAPIPRSAEEFSYSYEVLGDRILVGNYRARLEDKEHAGEVYLFDTEGSLLVTLQSPNPMADGGFGFEVDLGNDIILVAETGGNIQGVNAPGLVHVFDMEGSHITTLMSPSIKYGGAFGTTIDMNDEFIVISETGSLAPHTPLEECTVYIFDYSWNHVATLQSPDRQNRSNFGLCVDISSDLLLVGEIWANVDSHERAGRVHIYDTEWNLKATLQAPDPEDNDEFGRGVDIGGDLILVGERKRDVVAVNEGMVYVYDLEGNPLTTLVSPEPEIGAHFGWGVETDGEIIIVSEIKATAGGETKAGKVHVFGLGEPAVVEPVDEGEPVVEEEGEETKRGGGIPGFPLESIILGVIAVIILWRIRKF